MATNIKTKITDKQRLILAYQRYFDIVNVESLVNFNQYTPSSAIEWDLGRRSSMYLLSGKSSIDDISAEEVQLILNIFDKFKNELVEPIGYDLRGFDQRTLPIGLIKLYLHERTAQDRPIIFSVNERDADNALNLLSMLNGSIFVINSNSVEKIFEDYLPEEARSAFYRGGSAAGAQNLLKQKTFATSKPFASEKDNEDQVVSPEPGTN